AQSLAPAWRQRQALGALKPGTVIPSGTAGRFDRIVDDGPDAEQLRIHLPVERRPIGAAQPPKPSLRADPQPGSAGGPPGARGPSVPPPAQQVYRPAPSASSPPQSSYSSASPAATQTMERPDLSDVRATPAVRKLASAHGIDL